MLLSFAKRRFNQCPDFTDYAKIISLLTETELKKNPTHVCHVEIIANRPIMTEKQIAALLIDWKTRYFAFTNLLSARNEQSRFLMAIL